MLAVAALDHSPATKYGRFSRLLAYAQAADQHVWSAASAFMGTVCGDLLSLCVCSMCRVARTRAARTLRFRRRSSGRAERRICMPSACRCSCPTQTASGFGRGDLEEADHAGCRVGSRLCRQGVHTTGSTPGFTHGMRRRSVTLGRFLWQRSQLPPSQRRPPVRTGECHSHGRLQRSRRLYASGS